MNGNELSKNDARYLKRKRKEMNREIKEAKAAQKGYVETEVKLAKAERINEIKQEEIDCLKEELAAVNRRFMGDEPGSQVFSVSWTFGDILRTGKSLSGTAEYVEYGVDNLHSGATYPGTIVMDVDSAYDFEKALAAGTQVSFWTSRQIHWHPTDEKLPEDNRRVRFGSLGGNSTETGCYDEGAWWDVSLAKIQYHVTHWRELEGYEKSFDSYLNTVNDPEGK